MLYFSLVSLKTNLVARPFLILLVYMYLLGPSETFQLDVRHCTKVSLSASYVSAENVVCKYIDIFNREFFSLADIIKSVNNTCNNI
jgi:hypothetical protein